MFYTHLRFGRQPVLMNYVNIISEALALNGQQTTIVTKLDEIPRGADIISVTDRTTFLCGLLKKPAKTITWFQGICPEELAIMFEGRIDMKPRVWLHRIMERYALRHSDFNIFVSETMLEHYRRIYGYNGSNYFIMPCFTTQLNVDAFTPERYTKPSFLFSGSMIKWQCVDRMIELFKKIKSHIPEATLTIFTLDTDEAHRIADRCGIDVEIESVDSAELNRRMLQFKYGFIVRDDIAVNNVATPTKMNDYMAAGLIPVYSDVVGDYKKTIDTPYAVPFISDDECIEKILKIENSEIDTDDMRRSYESIFHSYWGRDRYVRALAEKFSKIL